MTDQVDEKVCDLSAFIDYLKTTTPDSWAVDVVRTKDGRNCMMGHLVDYVYGKGYEGNVMPAWNLFEELWATEYMFYPVNDGENPSYQQATAKERIIAYLTDILQGRVKNTRQLLEEV